MFIACGYNFCSDGNAISPSPITEDTYTVATLTNGILDHWSATNDATSAYSAEIPTWGVLTIMDADFAGNINAGNTNFTSIDSIVVKRRKIADFDWTVLQTVSITDITKITFALEDNFAGANEVYEYALVPVVGGVEGNYITNTIESRFAGVFICDLDTIYRFYAGVEYGTLTQVQKIGVFEPYGRQYPVLVSNGAINYAKGSFSGTVLPNGYGGNGVEATDATVVTGATPFSKGWLGTDDTTPLTPETNKMYRVALPIDSAYQGNYYRWNGLEYIHYDPTNLSSLEIRKNMIDERKNLMTFLTNKKAKVLKDWNGNIWLVMITSSPAVTFKDKSGLGLADVTAEYTEIGDPNSTTDMANAGLA